jgi:Uma2 family endonuclease
MATVVKQLGPEDHGLPMSYDEYMKGDYKGGYQYELIRGKLYVSPLPNFPNHSLEVWLFMKLLSYAQANPRVINYVSPKGRVFVPGEEQCTVPEPDVLAYKNFPLRRPLAQRRWQDVSPVLVAEILSADDPDKDLVRNVELYLLVPSIKEYWIIDGRANPDRPTMIAHRRYRGQWRVQNMAAGETYSTRMLPGFSLVLDPHR